MKKFFLFTFITFLAGNSISFAQEKFKDITIQTLDGTDVLLDSILINEQDKPVILFTWARSWCNPCVKTVNAFDSLYYQELQTDNNLKFVALNLDTRASGEEIQEFITENNWTVDVYQDKKMDFMKKLNVRAAPETYLIINSEIIAYKSGFVNGLGSSNSTAEYIYNLVKSNGEDPQKK
jgi:thiol-disulfide isomerase/thioredoxin